MALKHLEPGEVTNVLEGDATTKAFFKTKNVEVMRVAITAGRELPEHQVPGEVVVHCLQGTVAFTALGDTRELKAGQLLYLPGNERHSVQAVEDSTLLLTILIAPKT